MAVLVSTATRVHPRAVKAALMIVIVAGAWAGMALIARRLVGEAPAGPAPAAPGDDAPPTQALREQLLHTTWQELGIRPRSGVWGVLMELGFAKGVATVVGLADGNASLYLTSGGGVLGAGVHPSVRSAALKLCDTAANRKQEATTTTVFPRPSAGRVRFYLLTDTGVLTAEDDEGALRAGKQPLSPLYAGGQEVVTALRVATGTLQAGPSP
jgi:hypothetical protein